MPDLYAINLHLQERLEGDARTEVPAPEAARWLDEAGLLRNYKNGLPLRRLLRAGRIAGQKQRPNEKGGSWFIRRLAESRDPKAIRQAREQMRRYLPLDRDILHPDWPLSMDNPEFWRELGMTLAAFGYLEHQLKSACDALMPPPTPLDELRPDNVGAYLDWYAKLQATRTNMIGAQTVRLGKLLEEDDRVPQAVREELVGRLEEVRPWRNALCHGAWFGVDSDGRGVLSHHYRKEGLVHRFQPRVTCEDLSGLRAKIVDAIIRVVEVSAVVGSGSGLAAVMPRKYEPRNARFERE